MVGVLGISWALPLGWPAWAVTATAFTALTIMALGGPLGEFGWRARIQQRATVAACCLASIGFVGLGYAAYALTHLKAFGPVGRLGYPLLVTTGLRLPGGVCLLLLCGLVSVIPVLFRDEELARDESLGISGRS